jgi:hypothetical protein
LIEMITDQNIVCFSNDWRNDPTSKHQIMKLLARKNKVLWINSIGLRKPALGRRDLARMLGKVKSFARGLEKASDNLYVFTPVVIPFHDSDFIRSVNAWILEKSLKYYIKRLGMKDVIYWSYMPNVGYIMNKMNAKTIIYHCVDEWSKFTFIDDRIIDKERELCEMANLVLASARSLFDSRKAFNKNTFYVSHGVDYDYFHKGGVERPERPRDIAGLSGPIAGFFGLIHEWIDLDLVDYLARNNRDVDFVFIGKKAVDIERFDAHPNTHFLGQKTYEELIDYAAQFDVGLIPFKVNELTVHVNPIKLKEYFAIGIPVVSVKLPEVCMYEHIVRVAEDYESFDRALKEELSGRHKASAAEIDRVARSETWEAKVERISELVFETCGIGKRGREYGSG